VDNGEGKESELWVSRISTTGSVLWTKFYGGPDDEFGGYLAHGVDGEFWLCGSTWSFGNGYDDVWVLKLDQSGNTLLDTTIGGPNSDVPAGICATADGGVAIVGISIPDSGSRKSDISLVKLEANGRLEFQKEFGGPVFDYGKAVVQIADGGFLLAGTFDTAPSTQNDFDLRFFLARIDRQGDTVWTRNIVHPSLPSIVGGKPRQVVRLGDGSYLAIGDMSVRFWPNGQIEWIRGDLRGNSVAAVGKSDFLLAHEANIKRIDKNGTLLWSVPIVDFSPDAMCLSLDRGIVLAGFTDATSNGYLDGLVLKTNCQGELVDNECSLDSTPSTGELEVRLGPNPITEHLQIEWMGLEEGETGRVEIFDTRGRRIDTIGNMNNAEYIHSMESLPSGIYLIRAFIAKSLIYQQKFILLN
jgi:hypothetical protein